MQEFFSAKVPPARKLIVVLHGYRSRKFGRLKRLITAIREDMPNADVLAPELETARLFSMTPAAKIAGDVVDKIERRWQDRGGYDEVILVGHSTGGALARKVMLGAWGATSRVPFEATGGFNRFTQPFAWAEKITRLVLIAGISSGWKTSGREAWKEWLMLNFFGLFGHLMPIAKPTVFDFRRGSPFIANTRLQMVDHLREQMGGRRPQNMTTIQMLGSTDGMIAPNESHDFNADNALDDQLFILQVPYSDHVSILNVTIDAKATPAEGKAIERRRNLLQSALYGEMRVRARGGAGPEPLIEVASDWNELDDHMPRGADPDIKNVVFVIHGIRDDGHWTKKIAARVKERADVTNLREARDQRFWRSVTPSYGYFAMLPFALPWIRRQKVEWLMHEYCEAAAQYPNATFHFVGHSNGTYLGAAAMRDYAGCRFKNVVFAGSVVHPGYDWAARSKDSAVEAVLNYVATRDWVVAMAPNAVRHLGRVFDLGGAGHLGFRPETPDFVTNIEYVSGGHGAAIAEDRWDEIARFIVDGTIPLTATELPAATAPGSGFQSSQGAAIRNLARVSPLFAIIAVVLALGILVDMVAAVIGKPEPSWFAGLMNMFEMIPGLGWVAERTGEFTTSLAKWWFSFSQEVKLTGLVVYAGLLRFITTRY